MINILKELNLAKKAALVAGSFLANKSEDKNKVILSTQKDIKLNADIKSEEIIKRTLKSESDLPILAEESVLPSEPLPDCFWVVDPLDGTANYARDIPLSCVSIGIISGLEPILGVIYDFNSDTLFEGSLKTKAMCNNKHIAVSNISNSNSGIFMTGLPNNTDYSDGAMQKMIKNFQNWRKVRMIGSAAIAATYVASGKAEAYSETRTYLWDIAAGAAIVNAAGGIANISNMNDKFQVDVLFTNSHLAL